MRTISVRELVNMFVTISYLQEQRIIKYNDIYMYILENVKNTDADFGKLIHELIETIDDLINDGILSDVQPGGVYRISDKINFLEISKYPKDYLDDMNLVFFDIIRANRNFPLSLTLSAPIKKK